MYDNDTSSSLYVVFSSSMYDIVESSLTERTLRSVLTSQNHSSSCVALVIS